MGLGVRRLALTGAAAASMRFRRRMPEELIHEFEFKSRLPKSWLTEGSLIDSFHQ